MRGTPVTLKLVSDYREDCNRWLTQRLHQYATELGVALKGEHALMWTDDGDLPEGKALACRCGWRKRITSYFLMLSAPTTTASVWVHDALKEHVLGFTDPNHYTYYPQGV